MRQRHRGLFLILCALVLAFLTIFTAGCSGGPVKEHAVSGRVTFKDDPSKGVEGVTLSFGTFGTSTTSSEGEWTKNGLRRTVRVSPAKEGLEFTPGSTVVSSTATNINFSAIELDYMGLTIGAKWEYDESVTITGIPNPPETAHGWAREEVVSTQQTNVGTLFTIEGEEQVPNPFEQASVRSLMTGKVQADSDSFSRVIHRKGNEYFEVYGIPEEEHLYLTAPLNIGATLGSSPIIRKEQVTTPAGAFQAWYCERYGGEDTMHVDVGMWYVPYVGTVKIVADITDSTMPGLVIRHEVMLNSYTKP